MIEPSDARDRGGSGRDAPDLAVPAVFDRAVEALDPASMIVYAGSRMGTALRARLAPEDVWQEALVQAWRDRGRFTWQGPRSFRRWLLTIVDHRVVDLSRHLTAERRGGGATEETLLDGGGSTFGRADATPLVSTTPSRVASHRERARILEEALAALPETHREILWLRLFEDVSVDDIARRLELPPSTVKHRVRVASEEFHRRVRAALRSGP